MYLLLFLHGTGMLIQVASNQQNIKTEIEHFIQHFIHNICNDDLLIGANVRFRFLYFADYLLPGSTFLFREGRAKGAYFSSIPNCLYLIII